MKVTRRRSFLALTLAASAFSATISATPTARAEDVDASPKGIVGGALLGAEVVVIGLSVARVRNPWIHVGGAVVGAGGGGALGYVVEQSSDDGKIPMVLLAGGLALFIPSLVLSLNATRYIPPEGATEDRAPTNVPPADPGNMGGNAVQGSSPATATPPSATPPPPASPAPATAPAPAPGGGGGTQGPQALFDVHPSQVRLGVPTPQMRSVFTNAERQKLGTTQVSEVHFGVVNVSF